MHDLLHQQDSSKSQTDEELLDVDILLDQLFLHQDLFIVLHLAVLRDGGVAVELQLVVTVLRLAWLVVGVLVGVVVGQGHLAELLLRGVGHGARLKVLKRDRDEGNHSITVQYLLVWKSPPGWRPARTPCKRE